MTAAHLAATVVAGLVSAAVVVMGTRALWAPASFAGFGITGTSGDDPTTLAWIRVKGVRDLASGLILVLALAAGGAAALGPALLLATLIPLGDAVIVLRSGGPRATWLGVHGLTAAVMLVTSLVLVAT